MLFSPLAVPLLAMVFFCFFVFSLLMVRRTGGSGCDVTLGAFCSPCPFFIAGQAGVRVCSSASSPHPLGFFSSHLASLPLVKTSPVPADVAFCFLLFSSFSPPSSTRSMRLSLFCRIEFFGVFLNTKSESGKEVD